MMAATVRVFRRDLYPSYSRGEIIFVILFYSPLATAGNAALRYGKVYLMSTFNTCTQYSGKGMAGMAGMARNVPESKIKTIF